MKLAAFQLVLALFTLGMVLLTLDVQRHIVKALNEAREARAFQLAFNDNTIHIENKATEATNDNTDSILILTKAVNDIYDRLERLEQQCNPKKMESTSKSLGDL